jgi:hypothetical protein
MRKIMQGRRLSALTVLAISATLSLAAPGLSAGAATAATATPGSGVAPRAIGELDCNGLSPVQQTVKPMAACADPRGSDEGRFEDNGHYIGHDEPSIRYISGRKGSGNNVTYTERLPVDPKALPTVAHPGRDVTHWFELSVAPWLSTTVCDPNSAPLAPCTPRSDANAPHGSNPGGGAGFVELQFYPPGFAPFADSISCDNTHWCSALNIDSLECQGNGSNPAACNNNCIEPVNFSFVQTNGVPAGPPSAQLSDLATFTPNRHTLLMNPGDLIRIHLFDARTRGGGRALEAQETDLTTGRSGFMQASAANGFMNTDPVTCAGTPFNFQSEYSTARPANVIPWGIGPYMINSEFEVGHFEPCTRVKGKSATTIGSFTDTYFTQCVGPYDTTAEDPNLEPDDSPCFRAGDTHGGTAAPNLVTGCDVFFDAIGDLDYDGTPYYPDWPNTLTPGPFPSPVLQQQPVTTGGHTYSRIQFVTDASATEFNTNCDLVSGSGCVLPPRGPGNFYPFWTLAKVGGQCVWEFGNMHNGRSFGGDAQYGSVGPTTIGAFAGPIRANPGRC